ncbi:uncharacterized protein LOC115035793 [Echeneis naucrates]|uniref:uncharacterized protein LOC115035793 n=1 Tax=Echeneis naucrates TaxID=173247 RepID=UPI0011140D65|nr:uncharacterized protein LOC115035793 [Echeneis naucrates]
MGSCPSKKKVAPACVSEVNVTKTSVGVTSPKQDSRPFKPLNIHAILRNVRNRAQPEFHSDGHDSDFSGEEGEGVKDYEETKSVSGKKKSFIKSKTYGLCHFSRGDAEEDSAARPGAPGRAEEPRGSHGGSGDVNKRRKHAVTHFKKHTPVCPSQHNFSSHGCPTRGALLEAVPTPAKQPAFGSCHGSSLTMPAILYDGSEMELMDTIEKEFS